MNMRLSPIVYLIPLFLMMSCKNEPQNADLLLVNGNIYTVDESFSRVGALAIKDGRILATGTSEEITGRYTASGVRDLEGAFVYPGWIDAHCHFFGYGMDLRSADLVGTGSVEEVVQRLKEHHQIMGDGWITGRGWDQNDWEVPVFPTKEMLDAHFPHEPVLLRRIDGHAAWANSRALELAGVGAETRVEGGAVLLEEGKPTGILVDNAIGLVSRLVPGPSRQEMEAALMQAQENCFRVGLTSVQDAGLDRLTVELIDSLYRSGTLKIRMNTWLSPTEENFTTFVEKGPIHADYLTINTIKLFADGALGSRGARLLEPYSDDPGNMGLFVESMETLEAHCRRAYQHGFAVATHAIGDGANRAVLELYASILPEGNDRRWRIEHSQIIHPGDFHLFGDYGIIPSVQPTHATSDMYWAEERLGRERMKGAYAYRTLLEQNGWLPGGSDFPVEDINPLYGFYAATARKDQKGYPEGGFIPEEALTREQALRAMTIWAAKAGFEEVLKGSIEPGKLADLVVTRTDLMTAPETELFRIPVLETYVGGERVYAAN